MRVLRRLLMVVVALVVVAAIGIGVFWLWVGGL